MCTNLLAVDISDVAVQRAKKRLQSRPNVAVHRATLPGQFPEGRYDLIVSSDVLYYLFKDVLREFARTLKRSLVPGGRMFALHYLGSFGQSLSGQTVHDILRTELNANAIRDEMVPGVGPTGPVINSAFWKCLYEMCRDRPAGLVRAIGKEPG